MSLTSRNIKTDLCVIGGGLSGMSCAIRAARLGLKVVIIQDRPVFGGNASNEVRMWICGAQNQQYKETGLLEEINIENYYLNPNKNFYIWNSILNNKVTSQKNLISLLNTTCFEAKTENNLIVSVKAFQMTTQTMFNIKAKYFADCSGDSITCAITNAKFMYGREDVQDFGEKMINHFEKDDKTMGNSLLIQARQLDHKVKFIAPSWAEKISVEKLKSKGVDLKNPYENFWYVEIGGASDVIKNAENLNKRLLAICMGVWDTIKNSGEFDADNFDLEFVGFLPAKRESRRMLGDYILTGNDIRNCKHFDDAVAYGGWPMDDHNPDGFDGEKSNFYIDVPKPYEIPYRCLYSKNIKNLFFAGRNISLTHMANSSARVMGTCAVLGEAVGTASYVAKKYSCSPRDVLDHIGELQQLILLNDGFIPNVKREVSNLSLESFLNGSDILRNGEDRDLGTSKNSVQIENGKTVKYEIKNKFVKQIKIVFDSDLERNTFMEMHESEKIHPTRCNQLLDSPTMFVPKTLAKEFSLICKDKDDS
ncbi:MAG: FAD-dependent oxidoreductase, partial [bacterium]|nr:FAD-dependent oxidoreductase [bacterium]